MKKGWEKVFAKEEPPGLEAKVLARVQSSLERNARVGAAPVSQSPWFAQPFFVASLGAVAAVLIVLRLAGTITPQPHSGVVAALEPAMVRDTEMFLDLGVLENWDNLKAVEKTKKWRAKKKT